MRCKEKFAVKVTDAPYLAKGDGRTNDRAAIQHAIDDAFAAGGGTVELAAGLTFLSGNIVLKSGVELHFGDGATLFQSSDPDDYIKPVDGGYELCRPQYGHNLCPEIKWSHLWYYNLPFIYAEQGTNNFKITGNGIIRMMPDDEPEKILRICPVGFYKISDFEVSDVTITDYHSYGMMPFYCRNGLIKNVTIEKWSHGNGDGICLMNCRDIRITGCRMFTGDDSVYIFSSYKDPRGGAWWSSDEPEPSVNIEIDHNHLESNHCKAFGMILWGIDCPDQSRVEVRNVYVHDNYFQTIGNWNYNPYTTKNGCPPVTHLRFENNRFDAIEPNFFETQISDMNFFRSTRQIHNGDFESGGMVFWVDRNNGDENSVSVCCDEDGNHYGCISALEKGDAAIYQGLYISAEAPCCFWAKLQSSGEGFRMFVRDLETQELVACKEFSNTDWQDVQLDFTVPKSANYHVGIEQGSAKSGWAKIDNAVLLGNCDAAFGYARVGTDPQRNWKPLYFYDPDLWKNEE